MTDCILAIDQGTTNTKVLLVARDGAIRASASAPVEVAYPRPGWAEASSEGLWQSVRSAIAACRDRAPDTAISAIGISNQRESILLWDRTTGEPVGPCVIWQCRRSAARLAALRSEETETLVKQTTGLDLDPLFPAAKIGWLLDNQDGARAAAEKGRLCAGTVDSWLLYRLTGGAAHATDASNASRTQLFDLHARNWSDELCALFDVPRALLPEVKSSDAHFGETAGDDAIPAGIPVHAMIGDSHAALFGHGVRAPGQVKATFGTGSSLMTLTEQPQMSRHGLSTTLAWQRKGQASYAIEGNITVSGHAAAWAAGVLGFDDVAALSAAAGTVPDSGGVAFVPALAGLGAPHWDAEARGLFAGMSLSTTRAHLARATLEAIAFQVCDVFTAMEQDLAAQLDMLLADGGATANKLLMQIQSDILARPIRVSGTAELSAMGAAMMAGAGIGTWTDDDMSCADEDRTYLPRIADAERAGLLDTWAKAVRRARLVAADPTSGAT